MVSLKGKWALAAALLTAVTLAGPRAVADGTETLGPPSIDIVEKAGGFVAEGTGLAVLPGVIEIEVPAEEEIRQVLLYWEGEFYVEDDDTLNVNGVDVIGTLIGGPTYFYNFNGQVLYSAYRADITDLDLVVPGDNTLTITGLDYDLMNLGAGIIVIFGDCHTPGVDNPKWPYKCKFCKYRCCKKQSHKPRPARKSEDCSSIDILDGLDLAFFDFDAPREETIAQTFTFSPAKYERTADLTLFVGSVGENRPNQVLLTVNGTTTEVIDLFQNAEGVSFDAPTIPVGIPANATSLTVQLVSTESTDPLGASLSWITAGLSVPDVVKDGKKHCKPRHHWCKKDWNKGKKKGKGWCRKGWWRR